MEKSTFFTTLSLSELHTLTYNDKSKTYFYKDVRNKTCAGNYLVIETKYGVSNYNRLYQSLGGLGYDTYKIQKEFNRLPDLNKKDVVLFRLKRNGKGAPSIKIHKATDSLNYGSQGLLVETMTFVDYCEQLEGNEKD